MTKKILTKAFFDGLTQFFILFCLGDFVFSVFSENWSLEHFILLALLGAILSAFMCVIFTHKILSNSAIVCFSLTSILCFLLCVASMLAIRILFKVQSVQIFPMRDINDADGILFLFSTGYMILFSIILKVCIFIILIIRNAFHKNKT